MSDLIQSSSSLDTLSAEPHAVKFLQFQLYPSIKVMLGITQITEVLKLKSGQIVPIPQMPSWVMGVYNWRGDILWMIDLGELLGLDSWHQYRLNLAAQTAIVLSPNRQQANDIHLGLVVAQVDDLEMCNPNAIQSSLSSQMSPRLESFLQGYWLKPDGEMILALDPQAIAAAMPSGDE